MYVLLISYLCIEILYGFFLFSVEKKTIGQYGSEPRGGAKVVLNFGANLSLAVLIGVVLIKKNCVL